MTFPGAKSYLAGVLRAPRHDDTLNDKLVHNNRVYHLFKEQGTQYNGRNLLRSQATEASAPRIDGVANLSQLSEIRLEKLRRSLAISQVLTPQRKPNFFYTALPDDESRSKMNDSEVACTPGKSLGSQSQSRIISARGPQTTPWAVKQAPNVLTPREAPQSQAKQELQKILDECKAMKGNSYGDLSEFVQKTKTDLGVLLFQERKKQMKAITTADKMHHMNHNLPNILRTIYAEDKQRTVEQSEDEMAVLRTFEARKLDTAYFKMLENKK